MYEMIRLIMLILMVEMTGNFWEYPYNSELPLIDMKIKLSSEKFNEFEIPYQIRKFRKKIKKTFLNKLIHVSLNRFMK